MKKMMTLLFCFVVIACSSDKAPKSLSKAEQRLLDWESIGKRYEALNRFSGTVIIANGQNVIFKEHYGKANFQKNEWFTDSTSFKMGAASEIFTAHIILGLVYQNMIALEDKVNKYLPEIKADYTIDQVLNHVSGLASMKQLAAQNGKLPNTHIAMANAAQLTKDNKRNISDIGYNLLGLIIEKVTAASFDEALEFQLQNQKLENTYYATKPKNLATGYSGFENYRDRGMEPIPSPNYNLENAFSGKGVKSTAMDLLRMTEPLKQLDRYGYLENDGFSFGVYKDKLTEQTIIVLSNMRHPVAKDMIDAYKAASKGESFRLPLLRKRVDIDPSTLVNFEGTYSVNDKLSFDVKAKNDNLYVILGGQTTELIPQSTHQFFMEEIDASLRFFTNENDMVIGVEMLDGFIDGKKIVKVN